MARYIDAEKLKEALRADYDREGKKSYTYAAYGDDDLAVKYSHGQFCYLNAMERVKDAPTADVVPRVEVERLEREIKALVAFKEYFSDLYGHGLAISNYHENGALEDFDNFYDAAEEEYESVVGGYAKKS